MNFEGIYCFDIASVRFAVYPDGPQGERIVAQISEETLHDGFGTREVGHRLLDVCRNNFHAIEPAVIAHYRTNARQSVITLTLDDLAAHRSPPAATHQNDAVAA